MIIIVVSYVNGNVFAKHANIPYIAEYVHNEEVQKIVKELEIDYSQGYYFSDPKPEPIVFRA